MAMAGLVRGAIDTGTLISTAAAAASSSAAGSAAADKNGHGDVDVANALKVSCDIFFYNTGARLGVDKIAEYAHQLTFGELSHIDLDGEKRRHSSPPRMGRRKATPQVVSVARRSPSPSDRARSS